MHNLTNILSGIGVLIAIYLILARGSTVVSIIDTLFENSINGIQVLQGRNEIITK